MLKKGFVSEQLLIHNSHEKRFNYDEEGTEWDISLVAAPFSRRDGQEGARARFLNSGW